ncbi:MAG: hypothetical protein IJ614_06860 [Prevotella sp.]|nr:hypothetical protein [Prevotella sp.]
MKKFYSFIAMAMLTLSANAQVTYDFTKVAPAASAGGGIVTVKYGDGNDAGEMGFKLTSVKDGAQADMVYLATDDTDFDKRFAIQNRKDAWRFRNTSDNVWSGIWAQYDRYFAILGLQPGDEITLVMSPDDQNRGMRFDVPDYDDAETGYYQCVSRAQLEEQVTAKMGAAGLTTETITAEQLAQFREEVKTNKFKIWDEAATAGFDGTLLLKSEGGQYIEKITITSAGGSETAIKNVKGADKADGKYYNLNGIEVAAPQKGVYIRNGKKVVVK